MVEKILHASHFRFDGRQYLKFFPFLFFVMLLGAVAELMQLHGPQIGGGTFETVRGGFPDILFAAPTYNGLISCLRIVDLRGGFAAYDEYRLLAE